MELEVGQTSFREAKVGAEMVEESTTHAWAMMRAWKPILLKALSASRNLNDGMPRVSKAATLDRLTLVPEGAAALSLDPDLFIRW